MEKHKKGFTLIELLVVITIIAALAGIVMTNFLGVRERAKDAKRKAEMQQLKNALRLYYNDYGAYPKDSGGAQGNVITGCGTNGTSACACSISPSIFFAAGGTTGCDMVYMKQSPGEFGTKIFYFTSADQQNYHLEVSLDNKSDPEAAQSLSRCPGVTRTGGGTVTCGNGEYCVCPD